MPHARRTDFFSHADHSHPAGPASHVSFHEKPQENATATPLCPHCHAIMVLRTYKQSGNRFWGCSSFPECKGVRPADSL